MEAGGTFQCLAVRSINCLQTLSRYAVFKQPMCSKFQGLFTSSCGVTNHNTPTDLLLNFNLTLLPASKVHRISSNDRAIFIITICQDCAYDRRAIEPVQYERLLRPVILPHRFFRPGDLLMADQLQTFPDQLND